jgi:hypothetical protein
MYDYATEREKIFTEDGQVKFLQIRDNAQRLLTIAGAFRLDAAIKNVGGDSWLMLACVDRLVELGEIREVTEVRVPAQYRVFVSAR